MKVGFIGYGNMAEALGSRWAGKHDVLVGGRDATKARVLADKFGHRAPSPVRKHDDGWTPNNCLGMAAQGPLASAVDRVARRDD